MTSIFLAGTMQGGRRGAELTDQGYRSRIRDLVLEHRPDATIVDPAVLMDEMIGPRRAGIEREHARLAEITTVDTDALGAELRELTGVFHRLLAASAASDVCIAFLPDHEPSMGTMAEMLSAHRAGAYVVAVTEMRQNLAVLACSNLVLPTLAALEEWLADGRAAHDGVRAGAAEEHP